MYQLIPTNDNHFLLKRNTSRIKLNSIKTRKIRVGDRTADVTHRGKITQPNKQFDMFQNFFSGWGGKSLQGNKRLIATSAMTRYVHNVM